MRIVLTLTITAALLLPGCLRVAVDPVEVKPITLNVNLRVDRELDDFFAFEREMGTAPSTVPATAPQTPTPATLTHIPNPEPTTQP